jgi:putative transposase
VLWIPKYRKKKLFEALRPRLGEIFHELVRQKEGRIEEGHLLVDHVHVLISIPPKYAVSSVIGFIKGKSAIHIARNYLGKRRNFVGESFWVRGFYASTIGRDEEFVRGHIKHQEHEDQRIDQLQLL